MIRINMEGDIEIQNDLDQTSIGRLYKQIEQNKKLDPDFRMYTLRISSINRNLYSETGLLDIFSAYGNVKKCSLITADDRRLCFISFDSVDCANEAIRCLNRHPEFKFKVTYNSCVEHLSLRQDQSRQYPILGPVVNLSEKTRIDATVEESTQSPKLIEICKKKFGHPSRIIDDNINRFIRISPTFSKDIIDALSDSESSDTD